MSNTYRTIFKSSALIGGAQVINILVGMVRTKAVALMIGPAGLGLVGLYTTATMLIGTITSMGIRSSGVRQIAEAVGAQDDNRIGRTLTALRLTSLVFGIIGMLVVLALCVPLSRLTFGDNKHIWGMAIMSLTLLFNGISDGQLALLQGMRQLKRLASSQVLSALGGMVAGIVLIYLFREDGVPLYLVSLSAFIILSSWWFTKRLNVKRVRLSIREILSESKMLLGMGIAFMVSALLVSGTAYTARILILRGLGKEAVGLYHATWTLSALYVGLVLNAMGTDFFPRLTAVASDNAAVNSMVNEQTQMGLLIAIPGVLATITLAPIVLSVFYSAEFLGAAEVIRWQIIGIALRVVSWPLGYIQLAKGKGTLFIITELAASILHVAFIVVGMKLFGLEGVGMAFALLYICYTIGILFVCRSLSGFKWSRLSKKILIASCSIVALTFIEIRLLPQALGITCGLLITICATIAALYGIQKLLGISLWSLLKEKQLNRLPLRIGRKRETHNSDE